MFKYLRFHFDRTVSQSVSIYCKSQVPQIIHRITWGAVTPILLHAPGTTASLLLSWVKGGAWSPSGAGRQRVECHCDTIRSIPLSCASSDGEFL